MPVINAGVVATASEPSLKCPKLDTASGTTPSTSRKIPATLVRFTPSKATAAVRTNTAMVRTGPW